MSMKNKIDKSLITAQIVRLYQAEMKKKYGAEWLTKMKDYEKKEYEAISVQKKECHVKTGRRAMLSNTPAYRARESKQIEKRKERQEEQKKGRTRIAPTASD